VPSIFFMNPNICYNVVNVISVGNEGKVVN
jgi:hypothetical protein